MSSKRTPLLVGNRLTQLPSYIPKILVIMDLRSDQHLPNSQPVCVCSFDASKKNSVAKKVGVRTLISNPHDRDRSSITSSFFFPSTLHIYIYIDTYIAHMCQYFFRLEHHLKSWLDLKKLVHLLPQWALQIQTASVKIHPLTNSWRPTVRC